MDRLKQYNKAIAAVVALIVATLNANGWGLPDDATTVITEAVILVLGTFGVYWFTNKEPK